MKRFMVVTDSSDPQERIKITSVLKGVKGKSFHWWHWMNCLWLIVDPDDNTDTSTWLARMRPRLSEKIRLFITEVDASDWAADVPPDAHVWLSKHWGGEEKSQD